MIRIESIIDRSNVRYNAEVQMEESKVRVVIADDEPITRLDLKELLEDQNYEVVGEASDGFDAIEVCKAVKPDLVLMDVEMPLLDGFCAAKVLKEEDIVDTIMMLTAYSDKECIRKAKEIGVSGYIVKPVAVRTMIPAIEVALAQSAQMKQLKQEGTQAKKQLESRKIIEKAKGYIMQEKKISEQEAYDYIRSLSQAKKLSMKRVAEMILLRAGGHA